MAQNEKKETMLRHIAIIMDGNGRWAKKRGLPRTAGHAAGAEIIYPHFTADAEKTQQKKS